MKNIEEINKATVEKIVAEKKLRPVAQPQVNHKDEKDKEGNQLYVQTYNPETQAMEDTEEKLVTRGLKFGKIAEVKHTAGTILTQTDWYITRKTERSVDIPAKVVTKRAQVVAESDRLETAIAGAADVEALIDVMQSQKWGDA